MELDNPPVISQDLPTNNLLLLLRPESSFSSIAMSRSPTALDSLSGSSPFPQHSFFNPSPSGSIQEARNLDQARSLLDNSLNDLITQVLEGHSVVAVPLPSSSKLQTSQAYQNINSDVNRKNGSSHVFPFQRTQIISRAVELLFDKLKVLTSPLTQFTTSVTYVKVRNQELIDLNLSSSPPDDVFLYQKPLEPDPKEMPWPGLRQIRVNNATETLELLKQWNHLAPSNRSNAHGIFCITLNQHKLPNVTYRPNTATSTRKFRTNISRAMSISSSNLNRSAQTVTITSTLQFLDVPYSGSLVRSAGLGKQIKEDLPENVKADMHMLAKLIATLGEQPGFKTFSNNSHDCTKFNVTLRNFSRKKALGVVLSLPCSSERQLIEIFLSLQENRFHDSNQLLVVKNVAPPSASEVLEQVAYLQGTIGKLREELSRVRDSTSITDLSNARISLSSVKTELSCELKPNVKFRQVSRHLTQIQGCYSRAFSDIFQAVSRQSNTVSDRQSIQSVCEEKITPIAKEYENSIQALELELASIWNPESRDTTKCHFNRGGRGTWYQYPTLTWVSPFPSLKLNLP